MQKHFLDYADNNVVVDEEDDDPLGTGQSAINIEDQEPGERRKEGDPATALFQVSFPLYEPAAGGASFNSTDPLDTTTTTTADAAATA